MKNTSTFGKLEKTESLAIYLKEINSIPLLTAEEEKEYAILAAKGDKKAKQKLVDSNLRFVVKIAKKYRNNGLSFSDLISEGNIGLILAADKFDQSKGFRFISYAVWWIKQTILKAISEKSKIIRLPVNRINELSIIEQEREKINGKVNIGEIAYSMNIDTPTLNAMLNVSKGTLSFDEPIKKGDSDSFVGELIKDETQPSPETEMVNQSLKEEIQTMLSTLSNREAAILKYRFGLAGEEPHSLLEVGMEFNLTKERIRQIEKKSIEKLKRVAKNRGLEYYVA
ncbi:MAG: sigma-70 family RNA polymerase sigma factor [Treponema sp.]